MQKIITLNVAQRCILSELLTANTDAGPDARRSVRELWRGLKLYEAEKARDKRIEEARERAREKGPNERPETVTWADLETDQAEYTIDDGYLRWAQKKLDEHDWSKVRLTDGQGTPVLDEKRQVVTVVQPVPPMKVAIIADTADAIGDALAVKQ